MATLSQPANQQAVQRIEGYPEGSRLFDLVVVVLSSWFLGGLYLDGWAHNNLPGLESFFTPWHFVMYSGFGATAFWLAGMQYRNVRKGYRWAKALPKGYGIALSGLVIFALSGVGDMVWHTVFGIEKNLEPLFSPTHIGLFLGMTMMFGSLLMSAWHRPDARGWRELFPVVGGLTMLYALWTFFAQYATVYESPAFYSRLAFRGQVDGMVEIISFVWILIPSVMLSGLLLFVWRRWQLPFGAITLMVGINAFAMQAMNANVTEFPPSIGAAIVGGLIADMLVWRLRPSLTRLIALRFVAWAIPFVYWLCFLGSVALFANGLWWKIPTWTGVPFVAGIFGFLLSYLMIPPQLPEME